MRPKDACRDRLPASPSPGRGKIHSGVQSLTGRRGGMEVRFVQPCGISLTSVQFVGVGEVSAAEAVIVVASVAQTSCTEKQQTTATNVNIDMIDI